MANFHTVNFTTAIDAWRRFRVVASASEEDAQIELAIAMGALGPGAITRDLLHERRHGDRVDASFATRALGLEASMNLGWR